MSFNFIFYRMPFGVVLTAYLLGISIILISPWLGVLAIIAIPWFARYASQNIFISIMTLACIGGALSTWERLDEIEKYIQSAQLIHDSEISFSGKVTSVNYGENNQRIGLKNVSIRSHGLDSIPMTGIFIHAKAPVSVTPGMALEGKGQFYHMDGPRNPGAFDYQQFYTRKGFYGRAYLETASDVQIIATNPNLISSTQSKIRSLFEDKLGDNYGLLTALILGDKSSVDPEIRSDFTDTGVIHVLAVSGLHVGYVLLILMSMGKIMRIPWGWDRLFIIIGLVCFCILTGGKPSVVRASTMAGLYILTPVVNRTGNLWNTIFLSALIILLFDPLYIQDLGFILSYTAVASIILLYQFVQTVLPDPLKIVNIKNKPTQFVWGLFLVSLSAQLGTLPITAIHFDRIPIISLIANLVVVPIIGILVATGFTIMLLGWIPFVGNLIGETAWLTTEIITWIAAQFSELPFAYVSVHQLEWPWALGYYILLMTFILLCLPKFRRYSLISGLIWISGWIIIPSTPKEMDVVFMDVGQGDATIVRLPNEKTILIDGGQRFGNRDYGASVVIPVLNHLNIKQIDWMIMSHPHSDHIGGLISIIEVMKIDSVYDSYLDMDTWTYTSLMDSLASRSVGIRRPSPGEVIELDKDLSMLIFAPDSATVSKSHINDASIVFKLVYGETSFLFTGDMESNGEASLLHFDSQLDVDVLKVGHHGSKTSTTDPFIKLVSPELTVVSVGYKNKFRHPSEAVLERIKQHTDRIHRTDQSGALWLRSNGKYIKEIHWK